MRRLVLFALVSSNVLQVLPTGRGASVRDAGHYVVEDAHEQIVPLMDGFSWIFCCVRNSWRYLPGVKPSSAAVGSGLPASTCLRALASLLARSSYHFTVAAYRFII